MADFLKIGQLIENLTGYVKVKIELLKLEIIDEMSKAIAGLFTLMVVLVLLLFVLAFGSITIAVVINHNFESHYLGYLIMTFVYLVFLVIVTLMARSGKLSKMIEDQIVKDEEQKTSE